MLRDINPYLKVPSKLTLNGEEKRKEKRLPTEAGNQFLVSNQLVVKV